MKKPSKVEENHKQKRIQDILRYLEHIFNRCEHEWTEMSLFDETIKCSVKYGHVLSSAIVKLGILIHRGSHTNPQRRCYHWNHPTPPTIELAEKVYNKTQQAYQKENTELRLPDNEPTISPNPPPPHVVSDEKPEDNHAEPKAIQTKRRVGRKPKEKPHYTPTQSSKEEQLLNTMGETTKRVDRVVDELLSHLKDLIAEQQKVPSGLIPLLVMSLCDVFGDLHGMKLNTSTKKYHVELRFTNNTDNK